jgi:multiphosphoryl transfer protein
MTTHQTHSRLDILAPLTGLLTLNASPLPVHGNEVRLTLLPDQALSSLRAPACGIVTELLPDKGWLVLSTPEGVCIEISGGHGSRLDTPQEENNTVQAGEAIGLLSLPDTSRGLSVVIYPAGYEVGFRRQDGGVEVGEVMLALAPAADAAVHSDPIRVGHAVGLHARPAAALANAAKAFADEIWIIRNGAQANAKSLIAIMALGVRQGDLVRIRACGPDAARAVQELAALIASGHEETQIHVAIPASSAAVPAAADVYYGIPAAPGLAVGNVFHLRHEEIQVSRRGEAIPLERLRLEQALAEAHQQLDALRGKLVETSESGIFAAHQALIADPELLDLAYGGIERGHSAAFAWRTAYSSIAGQFAGQADEFMATRANDIRDIGCRVLRLIVGVAEQPLDVPFNAVLIAEDLTPSDTARLDRTRVLGFCTSGGGSTSHVAILARSLGLPAICGIEERIFKLVDGTPVLMDGGRGVLEAHPSAEAIASLRVQQRLRLRQHEADLLAAKQAATTQDGRRIEIAANIGGLEDAQNAVLAGSDGVGLLRSEFLFLNRKSAPSEDEQARIYADIARALGPDQPLIIRTLDVGGDKPLPYLPLPSEENPFLGIRGLRLGLLEPAILRPQLRAILRAAPYGDVRIMFPMVSSLDEIRQVRAMLNEEGAALGEGGAVQVGVMIEVPSAALLAEALAGAVDFFSIGTNDLTQYTLAMDRGHPHLAKEADALHPAVLRLIAMTVAGARQHGKWVGVCGGLASEELAVPLLIGLGVDELSVSVPAIPAIKAQVRRLRQAECSELAQQVLALHRTEEVRAALVAFAARS